MGIEIKAGLDTVIDEASNITGSDVGWADKITEIAEGLASGTNQLGTAATRSVGTGDGNLPELDASGKLAVGRIPTTNAGGNAGAGLVPVLNASGLLASSMIPASAGGAAGGIKGIWAYTHVDPNGNAGTSSNRQYRYTWRPRDSSDVYVDCTTILILCTGGGGGGPPGPPATVNNASGQLARKGGGGGAGSTVMAIRTGITSTSNFTVRVGFGGDAQPGGGASSTNYNGTKSEFNNIEAGGGLQGNATGAGGHSTAGGIGQAGFGIYIPGGSGNDGTFDIYGGGSGGASFWGGGHNGGDGQNNTHLVAWGGGAGATHGTLANGNFAGDRVGKEGKDGIVVIIGW